jgi:hypothetical protein
MRSYLSFTLRISFGPTTGGSIDRATNIRSKKIKDIKHKEEHKEIKDHHRKSQNWDQNLQRYLILYLIVQYPPLGLG